MRPYELLFVLRPDLDDAHTEGAIDRVRRLVEQQGGTVDQIDRWGRRKLAYEIRHFRDGYYVVFRFKAPPTAIAEIERVLNITDEVIRFLTVRLDED